MSEIPRYITTQGLVGWWGFNGNAKDESGQNNDGTVYGATLTSDRFGIDSSAYSFNGISNYIEMIKNDVPTNFHKGLTVSFWFKAPTELDSTARHFILSKYNGMGLQIELFKKNDSIPVGSLRTDIRENGSPKPEVDIYSKQRFDDNQWHLGVLRWNAPYLSQFVDGVLISTIKSENTYFDAPDALLRFGCLNSYWINPSRYFYKGQLDDIGIWNRSLSDREITSVYNGCKLIFVQPMDQIASTGQDVVFSVDKSDSLTSYQWQSNASDLGWSNVPENATYSGVKSNELKINKVQLSNYNQRFRVLASYESCVDTSKIVTLSIADTCIISQTVTDTLMIEYIPVGIDKLLNSGIIKIYPNPAKDHVVLDMGNNTLVSGSSVRISNSLGQTVYNSQINSQIMNINLESWTGKGVYVFELLDNSNSTIAKKIILIK
ncbi:MAG: T9SS type A sorting domain-containing protein [Bacteroidales bacterium]|nr:T9SS type A sorting domain-containing protein [Bacteroidales bacterium]